MIRLKILALMICALSLAGCSVHAPNCAGWEKISLNASSAYYLASTDRAAGQSIVAHNLYGVKSGCWK